MRSLPWKLAVSGRLGSRKSISVMESSLSASFLSAKRSRVVFAARLTRSCNECCCACTEVASVSRINSVLIIIRLHPCLSALPYNTRLHRLDGFCYKHCVQTTPEADLVRGIRRWDLVALTINGIIGAGIFGLPSKVYALIGTYSLIAFVACALVVALIILCFAEVGSRFEETGGPYLYAREAFQPAVAFEIGWLFW